MYNKEFGEVKFSTGWKLDSTIRLFDSEYPVKINAKAYYEEDGITSEQERAYREYSLNKADIANKIEELLVAFSENPQSRFSPRTLVFERDGSYALLMDDTENPDDGIAVCISPDGKVLSQDEYL